MVMLFGSQPVMPIKNAEMAIKIRVEALMMLYI
jgi:hypothetical protein